MRLPARSVIAERASSGPPAGSGAKCSVRLRSGALMVMVLSGLPSQHSGQRGPLAGSVGTSGSGTG
ncbi:hypothetical protein STAL104432_08345 [Streptomyces albus]|nr:hypothetical protein [Streptomyces sp. GSL17-113]